MIDLSVTIAGLLVGFVVGMTGMGGGALMTPVLVLLFGLQPLAAISSDLVASMFMKPVGAAVHLGRKTVHRGLVLWLVLGSVPSAFVGVLLLHAYARAADVQGFVRLALGIALLVVALAMVLRSRLARARQGADRSEALVVRPVPTLLVGVVGGLIVGMTSVGSGSLMLVMLLMLYPAIRLSDLVGTDLVQAVPLVASAALAHLLLGDFHMDVTLSILAGSIPGIYLGARFSSRAPDYIIRPMLVVVLTGSALKLLGMGDYPLLVFVGLLGLAGIAYAGLAAYRVARDGTATES